MVSTSASAFASGVIEQKGLVLRKFKMRVLKIGEKILKIGEKILEHLFWG